jgi:hypothetical protein
MKYIDGQILCIAAQILRCHAEVMSGAYKLRKLQKATEENNPDGTIKWRDATEEEKLADSMMILHSQIDRLNEFVEAMASESFDPYPVTLDDKIRIPTHWLIRIVEDMKCGKPDDWEFVSRGGNILNAHRIVTLPSGAQPQQPEGLDCVDFIYNEHD